MKIKEICPHCDSNKTVKSGRYRHKRNRNLIQKYKCHNCNSYFSDQTLSKTCGQKRPDLNQKIMEHICGGVGILRTASILKTTKTTVQRKIKFLAEACDTFQKKYMSTWTKEPSFQFDEMETCEAGRYYTVGIPVVVEKKSHFIVGSTAQYLKSRCQYPKIKEKHDSRHKEEIDKRDEIVKSQIALARLMKPEGMIEIDTDSFASYKKYMTDVFGKELQHNTFLASSEEDKDRLFPVNNVMACMRADKAMLRMDTWHICKDKERLSNHLKIYTFYSNY